MRDTVAVHPEMVDQLGPMLAEERAAVSAPVLACLTVDVPAKSPSLWVPGGDAVSAPVQLEASISATPQGRPVLPEAQ